MEKRLTLKKKIERCIELEKKISDIERVRDKKIDELTNKYLTPYDKYDFNVFGEDEDSISKKFANKEEYVSETCGDDPLKEVTNKYKCPTAPRVSIICVASGLLGVLALVWTIIGYIEVAKSFQAETPFFQAALTIILAIVFIKGINKFRSKKIHYNYDLRKYKEEQFANSKLKKEHETWLKKVEETKKQYELEKKEFIDTQLDTYKKYQRALAKHHKEIGPFCDKCEEQTSPLITERDALDREIIRIIKSADDKIPDSKKFGLDLFIEKDFDADDYFTFEDEDEEANDLFDSLTVDYYSDLLPSLILCLKGSDMVSALLRYYEEEHEEKLEQDRYIMEQFRFAEAQAEERERNRIERERIESFEREQEKNRRQQAEVERERNRVERERIEAFEREQKENRRHQEKLAAEESKCAAARIRCAKCTSYSYCLSMSKNKNPNCPSYRD